MDHERSVLPADYYLRTPMSQILYKSSHYSKNSTTFYNHQLINL